MWAKTKSPKRVVRKVPARLARRRMKMRLIFFAVGMFMLLPMFVGVAWLSHHPRLNINSIEIHGANKLRVETLGAFLKAELDDGKLHIFSRENELLLARGKLAIAIGAKFPRIKTAEIPFTKFKQKMTVNITERSAEYLWCSRLAGGMDEKERCFLVDKDGYIFAQSTDQSALQIIYSKLGSDIPLRSYVTSKDMFLKIKKIFTQLPKEVSLTATSIKLEGFDAEIYLADGWFIKMVLNSSVSQQIANLKTVLGSQELQNLDNLKYIDLRFGNRVYYKYRDE